AIMGAPDDDLPRLIFADWLDEHGHGDRAAYIRADCRVTRGEGTPSDRAILQKSVFCNFQAIPSDILRGGCTSSSRGFLCSLSVDAESLAEHAETIFALEPGLEN